MEQNQARSKFWDAIDNVDRYLYGRKMKNFLIGAVCVLIVAPILDWYLEVPYDRLTWHATLFFMFYGAIIILAWVSGWRDDTGRWTGKRAISRLKTYYYTFRDTAKTTRTTSRDEILYNLGWWLFFGALGWKSLQILSIFIRKPIQSFTGHTMIRYIRFENFTYKWFWLPLITGVVIMVILYRSNPNILKRIKNDIIHLFGRRRGHGSRDVIRLNTSSDKLVLNTKKHEHVSHAMAESSSKLFNDFISALHNWHPEKCKYEYEYQDLLYRHLKNAMPHSEVELEFPIGDNEHGNKGRADIVIDETIMIEMKRGDRSTSSTDRAVGQITRYSEIWSNRGPVVLLLCGHEYDYAHAAFTKPMNNLVKLDRSVLTLVQEN